ncbi:hypothetical protein NQV05_02185 [Mycoplasmopsis agalactiae]|uniref:Mbov_0392 family ICE element protein n=1 Tax=Mycoplasmopsis agalactiae TaxID=2110 RepID=UPI00211CD47A|nr:hypothetical protein [Mycoplasmopsis agalactiae]UUM25192.1 hypothetical protein NQV05_02185 [Mycoplasmopsis agalactiae]
MAKYFEEEDIKNLLAFELEEDNEDCLRVLNEKADSFETEQEREAYISLLKDISQSINSEFREEFIAKIGFWLMKNNDLDELASLYQMTQDISENDVRSKGELSDFFYFETETYPFDYLYELVDEDLKINGLKADVKLAYKLDQINNYQDNQWIWINDTNGELVDCSDGIEEDFKDFLADCEIEQLLANYSYDLDDYLEDKQSQGLTL